MSANTWDALCWYLVHTHPKQEDRAQKNLSAWNVETFLPRLSQRLFNQFTGTTHVIRPLFPRYIFARFRLNDLYHKVKFTRGIHSLVSFSDYPTAVEEGVIELIKSRIGKDGLVNPTEELKPGDRVIVQDGPLSNFEGIFDPEKNDENRVRILLQTVSYQAYLEIDREMVRKIN
jgi:transcriptional antiterminator RfaH